MKYRVRVDMSFDNEDDARSLMNHAKTMAGKAISLNEGEVNEEVSYADIHLCGHDESPPKPCQNIESMEVRKQ